MIGRPPKPQDTALDRVLRQPPHLNEVSMKLFHTASLVGYHPLRSICAFSLSLAYSGLASAAGAGMPWETPLNNFLTSLTGPVAKIVGVAAIVITGLGIAFSEGGSGMRKIITVAFGLTIAFSATTFFLPLFGYAGGAAF
jgi:type IV secretory pathway VirB2 component (pilin)